MKRIRYTPAQRQAAVAQIASPQLRSIKVSAKADGITEVTLRPWHRKTIGTGQLLLLFLRARITC